MNSVEIKLFVMEGCQMCPQMERLFEEMRKQGAVQQLEVIDLLENPNLAQHYNVRSVPYYLINGVGFNGLKSRHDIEQLLQQNDADKWSAQLSDELSSGQLDTAEQSVIQQVPAREAMMSLLADTETSLVVRIGLSAIVENLAQGSILSEYEDTFIALADHTDTRIAIDALYYLSLFSTEKTMQALQQVAEKGPETLRLHAREILQESSHDQVIH